MDAYDPETFRRFADGLVDLATRWLEVADDDPQTTSLTPGSADTLFDEPLPRAGISIDECLEKLERDYVNEAHHLNHPRYIGHQVAPPIPVSAAVDVLASTMNNGMAVWEMSPTGTIVEHVVLRWFARELGWESGWAGTFVSGGSVGSLTGLAAARARAMPDAWTDGVGSEGSAIITSEASHYCIERAAGLLGLGSRSLVGVRTADGRMDPQAAAAAISAARAEGRLVLALVATAGTTPIGAVDDLSALADVAEEHGVWFHVDAAHAGAFLLSAKLRGMLAGIERADSLSLDLHKMMLQPISTAVVFCRERAHLEAAFAQSAPYLFHGEREGSAAYDLGALTLQCSKRADALRAWATLKLLGADGVAALQEKTVHTTRTAADLIDARPEFELLHRPQTNILCFRHVPEPLKNDPEALDRHNDQLRETLRLERFAYLTGTTLNGRRVLRMTFMNPQTELRHVEQVLDRLANVTTT